MFHTTLRNLLATSHHVRRHADRGFRGALTLLLAGAALGACSSAPNLTGMPAALEVDFEITPDPKGLPVDMPTALILTLTSPGENPQTNNDVSLATTPKPIWTVSDLSSAKTWTLEVGVSFASGAAPAVSIDPALKDGETLKYVITFTPNPTPATPGAGAFHNTQSYFTTPKM